MSSSQALSRLTLGVAATATATSASAAIVVFDINPDFQANHNANSSLQIGTLNFSNGSFPNSTGLLIDNYATNKSFYLVNNYSFRSGNSLLPAGTLIESGYTFAPFAQFSHYYLDTPIGTHYIALSYTSNDGIFYGWIEAIAAASNDSLFNNITFTRFAFNDVAGQSILAGQTTAIPEASTLGLVGGLFGLVAAAHLRRRKLKQAAASDKFLALAAGEKLN